MNPDRQQAQADRTEGMSRVDLTKGLLGGFGWVYTAIVLDRQFPDDRWLS